MGLPLKELLGGDLPPVSRTTVAIAAAGFIGAVLVRQFFRILRRMAGERWQAWALRREPGSCCSCCRPLALFTMSAADRRRFERGLLGYGAKRRHAAPRAPITRSVRARRPYALRS